LKKEIYGSHNSIRDVAHYVRKVKEEIAEWKDIFKKYPDFPDEYRVESRELEDVLKYYNEHKHLLSQPVSQTDYEKGVRDTLFRVSGQIECGANGNKITADSDYFTKPLNTKRDISIEKCWNWVKNQLNELCDSQVDEGEY